MYFFQKFVSAVKKVKNVRIFLSRDQTTSDEENDDDLYEGKKELSEVYPIKLKIQG